MAPKIIFINPPLTGQERYGNLAGAGVYMPPLGLGILASLLRGKGYKVRILDCEALRLNLEEAVREVFSFSPDFAGITASTLAIYSAAALAAALKKRSLKLITILGGPHLTALSEETMDLFPQFDIGVIGEGELTLVELLQVFREKNNLAGVEGIVYRENGKAIKTPPRPFIENLDTLPFPAWDLYPDLKKYYRPSAFGFRKLPCTSLITSRGCPGRCSFCNQGGWGRRYREHSAGYVINMVRLLYHKYGIRDLAIYDGTFGVNQKRLIDLCEMLIKEKLNLFWSCNFRVEMAKPEVLRLMKKAGCWGIAYGIESCSQDVLNFLQKDITPEKTAEVLRWTKEAGIISKGYIMIGTPIETARSFHKTLDSVLKLDLDLLTVNSFTPFPGTLDYQRADSYGKFNRDWKLLNEHNLVFTPKGLSAGEINYFIRLITRKFYLRPRILWRYIKMSFNPYFFKLLFNGLVSFARFTTRNISINKEVTLF